MALYEAHDDDDPELPDPSDMDQDDDVVLSRCPNCKKMIGEDSEICPRCGYFITQEEPTSRQSSPWVTVVWIAIIIAIILAFLMSIR